MWREEQLSERAGNWSRNSTVHARQILLRLPMQVCFQLIASCRWTSRERGLNKGFRKKKHEYFKSTASLRHDNSGILELWCPYFLHGQRACSQLQRRLERRNVFSVLLHIYIFESLRINRLFLYFCVYVFCHHVTCFCGMQGGNSVKCQEGEWAGHAVEAQKSGKWTHSLFVSVMG